MTPELQQQLAEYLKKLMETTQSAANFAADQLPLVVQEKILYGRVTETLQFVVFIAIAAVSFRMMRWTMKRERYDDELFICAYAASGIVFSILALVETSYLAQVWFAPRLYILEWAAHLMK